MCCDGTRGHISLTSLKLLHFVPTFGQKISLTTAGGTCGTESSSQSTMGFPVKTTLTVLVYTSLGTLQSLHTERSTLAQRDLELTVVDDISSSFKVTKLRKA